MGNIPLFESAFQKNQLFYIKTGTFVFIQEEIKYLAYRSLFKKVYYSLFIWYLFNFFINKKKEKKIFFFSQIDI